MSQANSGRRYISDLIRPVTDRRAGENAMGRVARTDFRGEVLGGRSCFICFLWLVAICTVSGCGRPNPAAYDLV